MPNWYLLLNCIAYIGYICTLNGSACCHKQICFFLHPIHLYQTIHRNSKFRETRQGLRLVNANYSPALKKWGYTGFAMSFRDSMTL